MSKNIEILGNPQNQKLIPITLCRFTIYIKYGIIYLVSVVKNNYNFYRRNLYEPET